MVARETIELAYLAVIQLLPARQRAVLLLRDVVGWSAAETAEALELSVARRQQRAAAGADDGRTHSADQLTGHAGSPTEGEQRLLEVFIETHEQGDVEGSLAVLRDDMRVTMPPTPVPLRGPPARSCSS